MNILGRESALSRLLEQTLTEIDRLDPMRDGPVMYKQLTGARPELLASLQHQFGAEAAAMQKAGTLIGAAAVAKLKGMRDVVDQLVQVIDKPSTPPAMRCALVGVLAHVALPHDIVPDDAPGGYGILDDAALLASGVLMVQQASNTDSKQIQATRATIDWLQGSVPAASRPALALAIQGVAFGYQMLSMLPPQVAEMTTQQLLDDPQGVMAPAAPPAGWQSPVPSWIDKGHWSHGAYFDNGNVVIPGGPSLIGGQVYIPS